MRNTCNNSWVNQATITFQYMVTLAINDNQILDNPYLHNCCCLIHPNLGSKRARDMTCTQWSDYPSSQAIIVVYYQFSVSLAISLVTRNLSVDTTHLSAALAVVALCQVSSPTTCFFVTRLLLSWYLPSLSSSLKLGLQCCMNMTITTRIGPIIFHQVYKNNNKKVTYQDQPHHVVIVLHPFLLLHFLQETSLQPLSEVDKLATSSLLQGRNLNKLLQLLNTFNQSNSSLTNSSRHPCKKKEKFKLVLCSIISKIVTKS